MPSNTEITDIDRRLQPEIYAKRGIALVRGEGAMLWDADGNQYIDAMSNYGVNILGHAHPAVTEAISSQAGRLINAHQSFASDIRAEFLEKLIEISPEPMSRAWLSNSGAEAIEAAILFARAVTGRTNLVAMQAGYHGRTGGAAEATAPKRDQSGSSRCTHVPFNNLDALDGAVDDQTAAIFVEPIQGEAGIVVPDDGYLSAAAEIARRNGALLVLDEVQTAFRTGTFFAAEHDGVEADIICTAKALANGVPIGATLVTEAVTAEIPAGSHGSTFGGNPLACAAGLATISAIQEEGLLEKSVEGGDRLRSAINALEIPMIRNVRGRGQMTGVELRTRVTPILRSLQDQGVLALPATNRILRFLPPLVITNEQIDRVAHALGEALE